MSNAMNAREGLLNRLVHVLVDGWGYEAVAGALANAASSSRRLTEHERSPKLQTANRGARPSATEQVERAPVEGEQKEALLQLAVRYDSKEFLPSVADVREFLIMLGERPVGLKDRKDAFRILLRSLTQLPIERLQQLARSAQHSGPSRLGPLSDAIAATSESLRRRRGGETE